MARDQSNDEAGSREPVTELPAQEYFLPNHQDGLKLKSDISKHGFPGDDAPSVPPTQERLVSESQEGQDSSVVMAVQSVIDHDDDQTEVSLPPSTTFRPVNMVLEERSCSPQLNSLVQEQGEQRPTAGRPESSQPHLENLKKSSGYSWQGNGVSQIRDAATRDSSSVNDQRRVESEAAYPKDYLGVCQPVLDQGSRNNGPSPTFDTRSHEGIVLSSMQMIQMRAESEVNHQQNHSRSSQAVLDQAPPNNAPGITFDTQSRKRKAFSPSPMTAPPSSEIHSSHRNQERLPPIGNISLPPNAVYVNPRASRWESQRKQPWVGYLPDINESRRFESQAPKGRPRRLVQGPTQPLGPPLKPFDGPVYEEKAQERWRRDHE